MWPSYRIFFQADWRPSGVKDHRQFSPHFTACGFRASHKGPFLVWANHWHWGGPIPVCLQLVLSIASMLGDLGENTLVWASLMFPLSSLLLECVWYGPGRPDHFAHPNQRDLRQKFVMIGRWQSLEIICHFGMSSRFFTSSLIFPSCNWKRSRIW